MSSISKVLFRLKPFHYTFAKNTHFSLAIFLRMKQYDMVKHEFSLNKINVFKKKSELKKLTYKCQI